MRQVQIFVIVRSPRESSEGRRIMDTVHTHAAGPQRQTLCRGGGLQRAQSISRAFRQRHCNGLSSRGCLTSSSRSEVLQGFTGCQMTCPELQAAWI